MAIKIGQPFERTSKGPIDISLTLTKAEMLTVNDDLMPNKYFTVCQDDGKIYIYDKNSTPSLETGKFSILEGGGSDINLVAGDGISIILSSEGTVISNVAGMYLGDDTDPGGANIINADQLGGINAEDYATRTWVVNYIDSLDGNNQSY